MVYNIYGPENTVKDRKKHWGIYTMEQLPAILITVFLGELGIHRFLAGKIGTGILWLLTGGCLGIGWLVDVIMVCTGSFTNKDGTPWVIKNS